MNNRFRIYRRKKVFYCEDAQTGKQESLRTQDRKEAVRIVNQKNEAEQLPAINLKIAEGYLCAVEPEFVTRTWDDLFQLMLGTKSGPSKVRWETAYKDTAYAQLKKTVVIRTGAVMFLKVLRDGGNSTNAFLRRIHNFALDMGFLPKAIIPKRQWPRIVVGPKRGISLEEHQSILDREFNLERKAYYQLCWHLGGSQGDIARLHGEDVNWRDQVIDFERAKTRWRGQRPPQVRFGSDLKAILETLPQKGPLFPYLVTVRSGDRATEFKQRCDGLGFKGITLHSYRYAWAERAKTVGYSERFAMIALGHNSKALAHAYSRQARTEIPALEDIEREHQEKLRQECERRNIIPMNPETGDASAAA